MRHIQYYRRIVYGAECSHDPILYIIKKKREIFCACWMTFFILIVIPLPCTKLSTYFSEHDKEHTAGAPVSKYIMLSTPWHPILPLIFAKVLACSAPVFFTSVLYFNSCSLSRKFFHKFITTEFVNVTSILSVKPFKFPKIY